MNYNFIYLHKSILSKQNNIFLNVDCVKAMLALLSFPSHTQARQNKYEMYNAIAF